MKDKNKFKKNIVKFSEKIVELSENEKEETAKKNLLFDSDEDSLELRGKKIEGYNFDKFRGEGDDWSELIDSFGNGGFQASNFGRGIEIVNSMIDDKAFIFLGYTSNMVSSGNRDIIRFLVENKKIDCLVTTAGGIEEDIIKCFGDFVLGNFNSSGSELREKGINRIGNIFVGNKRYVKFEEFMQGILEEVWNEQKKSGREITGMEIIWRLGEEIGDKKSIYYWAWKNKIPVYCPALFDGALGDNIYFFKFKHKDFKIDTVSDLKNFNDLTIGLKKSGVIILGAGVVKHSILNANMLRNGADYAVYINTEQEYNGSDSGALPEEAKSWGKLKKDCKEVKIFCDATLVFPLLVGKSFVKSRK